MFAKIDGLDMWKLVLPTSIFILLFFEKGPAMAMNSDSLVRWREIEFASDFERSAFSAYFKENKKDALTLFLATSNNASRDLPRFRERMSLCIQELKASENINKRNDKKIKFIYQTIHSRFFKKYETENRFHEIIENGNYNCVTATALFALFFEELGIPYSIKEEPTHVYLVAYPGAENIMIETTTPAFGFLAFDSNFKTNFVNNLKDQKIIGISEITNSSTDALFNKYYFSNVDITLEELIGIHYANDGLFKRDHQDMKGAYEQIKKALLFYPGQRNEFLLLSFSVWQLQEEKLPLNKAAFIGRLDRFIRLGITSEMIQGEFGNLTQDILLKRNEKDLYKKCYDVLVDNLTNSEIKEEIDFIFYHESGRFYYNQGNYFMARENFARALERQPNNVDLGGVFVSSIGQSFRNERNNRIILDSLESYRKKHKILDQNHNFQSMLALTYVVEFGQSFSEGNSSRGEEYQRKFEKIYDENKNITLINPDMVGRSYSEACVYFFKKGQKTKARQLLEQGLKLVPEDYQLKVRKQMINGY